MKPSLAAPGLLLALALALSVSSCSGDDDSAAAATDPADAGAAGAAGAAPQPPASVPAATGSVRSTGLPTVMDTGDGAELCLGAIAESYPPQCGGPAIPNWDWDAQDGTYDQQDDVRWGTYAVTGTWDGTSFTVTDALTGALYDPMMPEPATLPEPDVAYSADELEGISEGLRDELPGYQGSYADQEGHVLADVIYDDGSLQSYVDEAYGAGVVVLTLALVDVE
ncbi:hypothetical protein BH09ACT12_BH09ACT12_36730 [soil metagenome]